MWGQGDMVHACNHSMWEQKRGITGTICLARLDKSCTHVYMHIRTHVNTRRHIYKREGLKSYKARTQPPWTQSDPQQTARVKPLEYLKVKRWISKRLIGQKRKLKETSGNMLCLIKRSGYHVWDPADVEGNVPL